jgi:hypothetical protein
MTENDQTQQIEEIKETSSGKGQKKRSPSYNEDDWKLLSRNYLKDGDICEMITEAKTVGTGRTLKVLERNTVLHKGVPVAVSVVVIEHLHLQYYENDPNGDGQVSGGQWKYSSGN